RLYHLRSLSATPLFPPLRSSDLGDHRDLHSFLHDALPISCSNSPPKAASSRCFPTRGRSSRGPTTSRKRGRFTRATWEPERGSRSEEHTSELQSLRHLVCRLLLEKKNSSHLGISYAVFCLK